MKVFNTWREQSFFVEGLSKFCQFWLNDGRREIRSDISGPKNNLEIHFRAVLQTNMYSKRSVFREPKQDWFANPPDYESCPKSGL